jgi:serine/threonine protein kinase
MAGTRDGGRHGWHGGADGSVVRALSSGDARKLGPYTILALLGQGGMGRVYLGMSAAGEKVAVKVIKGELISGDDVRHRFAAEADNLRSVYGSRLARFENADLDDDPAWLATEYVPGLTLEQYIVERGPLDLEHAATLGAMLVEALERIHAAGLLHRDLKPRNIILGPDGPRVIDLGLAVLGDRDEGLTTAGALVGTPAYMAPEQARSEKVLTTAVDVYALAATLVYALTGSTVYPNLRGFDLIEQIRDSGQHPRTDGVPALLRSLVNLMLAYDPKERPALGVVKSRLIEVAEGCGRHIADVRRNFAELTYVEPPAIPPDPGGGGAGGPLENLESDLSPAPDEPGPDHRMGPEESADGARGAGGAGEDSAGSSGRLSQQLPPRPRTPIDLGWLVEQLRQEYAPHARF